MNYFDYRQGELWAEDVPIKQIIASVQTPCYIYSQTALLDAWQGFNEALGTYPHQICYAVKANSNLAVLQSLAKAGSGFDIVSGGELARVIAAGGNPQHIVFSGVGKTSEEMAAALEQNIFCFNIESEAELIQLQQVAAHRQQIAPIALRVNPNIDPMSHPYISTGLKESKFGIPFEEAFSLYVKAHQLSHIAVKGIACHIGSQLTQLSPFVAACSRLLDLYTQLQRHGIILQHIDVGGGLGVQYHQEVPPSAREYAKGLLELLKSSGLKLLIEPGRAIAAKAGILVTKVLYLKKAGDKHFCIVDCAMNDFLRPALYDAWQTIIPVKQSPSTIHQERYDIVGPVCESGDFLGKNRLLTVEQNDLLAICDSGAYGFVMSSNYNSRPRAAEVMVKRDDFKIVRPRETLATLWDQEVLW